MSTMSTTPHAEMSRPYFEREARKGRRVIFLWHVSKRWPDRGQDHLPDRYIEGVEFDSIESANRFDLNDHAIEWQGSFATWDEAEAWLRGAR
jgi:hypothetical protein